MGFDEMSLPPRADVVAPDGSDVRVLLALPRGSMAHFTLAAGASSAAVRHRRVEEIWYVLSGTGEMWRALDDEARIVALRPGVCVTIPARTHFQFRASNDAPLTVLGVTMPPWPGDDEAVAVEGVWP